MKTHRQPSLTSAHCTLLQMQPLHPGRSGSPSAHTCAPAQSRLPPPRTLHCRSSPARKGCTTHRMTQQSSCRALKHPPPVPQSRRCRRIPRAANKAEGRPRNARSTSIQSLRASLATDYPVDPHNRQRSSAASTSPHIACAPSRTPPLGSPPPAAHAVRPHAGSSPAMWLAAFAAPPARPCGPCAPVRTRWRCSRNAAPTCASTALRLLASDLLAASPSLPCTPSTCKLPPHHPSRTGTLYGALPSRSHTPRAPHLHRVLVLAS
mmetsp:Transcript_30393/g.78795  ORF Transcript_30393/g.78795 Transcript_30393/m.78795 type:complete len:264 (+) Transcript_30393:235-1026(+)